MFKIERHDEEFSPQEADVMSGVSQELQILYLTLHPSCHVSRYEFLP